MLALIDQLKNLEIIRFDKEFCDDIGLLKQNLVKIRNKERHFTPEHIRQAIIKYRVNANWIFGVSDKMFQTGYLSPDENAINTDINKSKKNIIEKKLSN